MYMFVFLFSKMAGIREKREKAVDTSVIIILRTERIGTHVSTNTPDMLEFLIFFH